MATPNLSQIVNTTLRNHSAQVSYEAPKGASLASIWDEFSDTERGFMLAHSETDLAILPFTDVLEMYDYMDDYTDYGKRIRTKLKQQFSKEQLEWLNQGPSNYMPPPASISYNKMMGEIVADEYKDDTIKEVSVCVGIAAGASLATTFLLWWLS